MYKKILKYLLVIVVSFSLIGCSSKATPTKSFDDFIKDLPKQMVDGDSMDVNYIFNDPSAYGIKKSVASLPSPSKSKYEEALKSTEKLLDELDAYDYDSLNEKQKLEYDVLKDSLDRSLMTKDYFYLDNNFLGSFIGFQAELPILLNEFSLNDKIDVETYLNILKTAKDTFKEYVENEKTRQKNDAGMSQVIIDKVIEQCDNFIKGDVTFLVDQMNVKLDSATFLTAEEKQTFKAQNQEYTTKDFIEAYQVLKDGLSSIKAKDKDGGINQQKNGKDYYEALVKQNCGIDMSIEELTSYLEDKYSDNLEKLRTAYTDAQSKGEDLESSMSSASYGEFKTANENIDYLSTVYKEYFPDAGTMSYRVLTVPDAMKDNFSPAAYLSSRVDRKKDEPLTILVNGDYTPEIFTTIAHEGYPGHMYQDCYFQQLNVATFRYLISCRGYTEGWATYVENNSYLFTKENNQDILKVLSYNSKLSDAFWAKMDIEINYKGMTREEFKKEVKASFSATDEQCDSQYDLFIETPGNYLCYYVNGFLFQDYHDKAKKELGSKFDEVAFNKVLLDTGVTSMVIVESKVDQYIKDNK